MTENNKLLKSIPRVVNSDEFGFFTRLKAKLGLYPKFENLFLGYCRRHKSYFLDLKHTGGVIRCPICDEAWLQKHGFPKTKEYI